MAPRVPASRKRSSEAASSPSPSFTVHANPEEDQENIPSHANIHLTPSKPPAPKRPRWDDKNETKLKAACAEIQLEVESRCSQLRQHAETLAFTLQCTFKTEMASLPRRVRDMPMSTFCAQYASDVTRVLTEDTVCAQRELDTWVAQTPRLTTARKAAEAVARTTRASARKQGLVVPPIITASTAVPASSRATRANARTKVAVYETPSRAATGKPRQVARTRATKADAPVDTDDGEESEFEDPSSRKPTLTSTLDTLQAQLQAQAQASVAPADKAVVQQKLKAMQEQMTQLMKQLAS